MSPYNEKTTAEEVASDLQSQIAGKTLLVTGVSPEGLGGTFVLAIAKHNPACLILATRTLSKAQESAKEIAAIAPAVRTWLIALDLSSQKQIRESVKKIEELGEKIDIIVNNAGIMAHSYSKTVDGIESQFGINHVGHFLLTNLLLKGGLLGGKGGRIVNVSSSGHRWGPVRIEDTDFDDGKTYNRWTSYAQSKTANMLFSKSLARKLEKKGVVSVSLHPGIILTTSLSREITSEDFPEMRQLDHVMGYKQFWTWADDSFKSASQGAATHIYAAFHPDLDKPEYNGSYLSDSDVVAETEIHSWARDSIEAEKLWSLSEELVGEKFEY